MHNTVSCSFNHNRRETLCRWLNTAINPSYLISGAVSLGTKIHGVWRVCCSRHVMWWIKVTRSLSEITHDRGGRGSGWGHLEDHIITIYINNTWRELIIAAATVQRMVNVDERSENQYRVLLRTATGPQSSRISSINTASFPVRSHTPLSCCMT